MLLCILLTVGEKVIFSHSDNLSPMVLISDPEYENQRHRNFLSTLVIKYAKISHREYIYGITPRFQSSDCFNSGRKLHTQPKQNFMSRNLLISPVSVDSTQVNIADQRHPWKVMHLTITSLRVQSHTIYDTCMDSRGLQSMGLICQVFKISLIICLEQHIFYRLRLIQ